MKLLRFVVSLRFSLFYCFISSWPQRYFYIFSIYFLKFIFLKGGERKEETHRSSICCGTHSLPLMGNDRRGLGQGRGLPFGQRARCWSHHLPPPRMNYSVQLHGKWPTRAGAGHYFRLLKFDTIYCEVDTCSVWEHVKYILEKHVSFVCL